MQGKEERGVKRKREAEVENDMAKSAERNGNAVLGRTLKLLKGKHGLLCKYLADGTLLLNQNLLLTNGTELAALAEMLSQDGMHCVEAYELIVEAMTIAAMLNKE